MASMIIQRGISTSCACHGKRNFRKFQIINKRGPREFKEKQAKNPDPDIPVSKRGVRDTGILANGKFIEIPEKEPELIVPDLKGFKLKPYVTYRSTDVVQSKFTAHDLFAVVYANKIKKILKRTNFFRMVSQWNPVNLKRLHHRKPKMRLARLAAIFLDE